MLISSPLSPPALLRRRSLPTHLIARGIDFRGSRLIPISVPCNECPQAQHSFANELLGFLLPSAFARSPPSPTSAKYSPDMCKLCLKFYGSMIKYDFR